MKKEFNLQNTVEMKNIKRNITKLILGGTLIFGLGLTSCTKGEDSAGYEFMPDMYRSPAIEAYVDYGLIGDSIAEDLKEKMSARKPVDGTIKFSKDPDKAKFNFDFPFASDPQGYVAAGAAILTNPIPYSEEVFNEGGVIFGKFCMVCHGESGKGDGSVVSFGKFASPGAFSTKNITVGNMYHAVTYGKGLMGSHASQLSAEERWKVIHYVYNFVKGSPQINGDVPVNVAVGDSTDVPVP